MYDRPETAGANDRLWDGIRARLGYGPTALSRDSDIWDQWQSPDLILSQTCGFPYRKKLAGHVSMLATPAYDIACDPGYYFSVFVVRNDDPRKDLAEFAPARFAYNDTLSQSGWAAPMVFAGELGFQFKDTIKSGAHVASARMVADGAADIAAIDAISWKMMQRWDPFASRLRVIDRTQPTPGLPLITSLAQNSRIVRAAVSAAINDLSPQDCDDLCLTRQLCTFQDAQYLTVPLPC